MASSVNRCPWPGEDPLYIEYHDTEWGLPLHNDLRLFEMLILEGAQAGLSWITILRKRGAYRAAFDGFDPAAVARYGEAKITELLNNPGIVRNQLKIRAAVTKAYLAVQDEFGSFNKHIWGFVDGQPVINRWGPGDSLPAETPLSQAISKDLKARGFKFVGPTIMYAHMQSTGMVNDHRTDCFRYHEIMA